MSESAISLKNISKCYRRYAHPADRLKDIVLPKEGRADEFWALRDINLDVPKGETLGIVGRNGSGKSTLLQIVAGTLTPTDGEVAVRGRVSALLELGTGFNPEFSGRENVFLNGHVMGLTKKQLDGKFDEIAAFADIGDFIDQPVKTYSSGMFVRLAFAVAISSDPDILIVDEALAVGDEAFKRKCYARIKNIQRNGGTILFVSHAAQSVIELCNQAVLLEHGELLLAGRPKPVISRYNRLLFAAPDKADQIRAEIRALRQQGANLTDEAEEGATPTPPKPPSPSPPVADVFYDPALRPQSTVAYNPRGASIRDLQITTTDGKRVNVLTRGGEYLFTYDIVFTAPAYQVTSSMSIKTVSGLGLGGASSHRRDDAIEAVEPGQVVRVAFKFRCLLLPGTYFLNAGVKGIVDGQHVVMHRILDAAMFRVQPESNPQAAGIVDFKIESNITFAQSLNPTV